MIRTGNLKRVEIYHNTSGETPEQIKAKTGCDTIVNGMLFNPDGSFCLKCKIGGKTLANEDGVFYGYGWSGENAPVIAHSDNMCSYDNYITSIHIAPTIKRGRTAISFYDGKYTVLCTSDSNGAMTIPQVEETMRKYNGQFLILDGGGSSYLDCPSGKVDASYQRKTANRMYILIWEDTEPQKKGGDKMKVCLDPGHGTGEMNQSPDGRYIEHEFALDMANRIRQHLKRCGVDVKLTREDSSTPSLTARANTANTWGADLYVSLHSNAVSNGWNDNVCGLTVWTYAAGGERDRAAKLLLAEMKVLGIQTFGAELYHGNFAVLRETKMPAYLIEYAFHTSRPDVELLKSDTHRDKLSEATAKAICSWGGVQWVAPVQEPAPPADGTIYRVQVGAFTVKDNADKLKIELESKGYKPYIVEGVK